MSVGDILAKAGVQAARQGGVDEILKKAGVGQSAPAAAPVQSSPKKTEPERIANVQSPALSYGERTFLNTVPATVDQQVDVLRQKGFEAKVDEKSGDVILRKPGQDRTWYKIEKTGWLPNELSDVTDIADEVLKGGITAAYTGAGLATAGPVGGVVGAGLGSGAAQAGQELLGTAFGLDQGTAGQRAARIGEEAAWGAATEGVFQGAGKALKGLKGKVMPQVDSAAIRAKALADQAKVAEESAALAKQVEGAAPGIPAMPKNRGSWKKHPAEFEEHPKGFTKDEWYGLTDDERNTGKQLSREILGSTPNKNSTQGGVKGTEPRSLGLREKLSRARRAKKPNPEKIAELEQQLAAKEAEWNAFKASIAGRGSKIPDPVWEPAPAAMPGAVPGQEGTLSVGGKRTLLGYKAKAAAEDVLGPKLPKEPLTPEFAERVAQAELGGEVPGKIKYMQEQLRTGQRSELKQVNLPGGDVKELTPAAENLAGQYARDQASGNPFKAAYIEPVKQFGPEHWRMSRTQYDQLLGKMSEGQVRDIAHEVGIQEAWDAPLDQIKSTLLRDSWKYGDYLAEKRSLVNKAFNEAIQPNGSVKPIQILTTKRDGTVRSAVVTLAAPPGGRPVPREIVAEFVDHFGPLDTAKHELYFKLVRGKEGKLRRVNRFSEQGYQRVRSAKKLKEIAAMNRDEFIDFIMSTQKQNFWSSLSYNPKTWGLRPMYDLQKKEWLSLPLDGILGYKVAGGKTVWFQPQDSLRYKAGRALRGMGERLKRGQDVVSRGVGKALGLPRQVSKVLGSPGSLLGVGVLTGHPIVQALAALSLSGRAMSYLGRAMQFPETSAFARLVSALPRHTADMVERIAKMEPNKARTFLAATIRQNPEFRRQLEQVAEALAGEEDE